MNQDHDWIQGLQNGQAEALRDVYNAYKDELYSLALVLSRNRAVAEHFRRLFQKSLAEAKRGKDVTIGHEVDPNTQQEMIVIDAVKKHRNVRFWIDPETMLPMRFTTTKTHDLDALRRQTIAVRDIWDIRYNEPVPPDAFARA